MKIRTMYTVTQKRIVEDCYTIEATSKAEALRKFEEGEHGYDYESYYTDKDFKPSAEKLEDIYECPNKGEAWTEIPLDKIKDMDFSGYNAFDWHYNDKCVSERTEDETHCFACRSAMRKGHRLLTLEEKKYLKRNYSFNDNLNTEE